MIVRERGIPKISKKGKYIFQKDGIYFSLDKKQMRTLANELNEFMMYLCELKKLITILNEIRKVKSITIELEE